MSAPGVMLPAELVDFVESGVSALVGTRDAQLRPAAMRAMGCIVAKDRRSLAILLPEAAGRRTIANLEAGSPIAVTFSRIVDHRTVQVKGSCLRVRAAGPVEQEATQRYLAAFTEALYFIGVSRATARRVRLEPCVVAELEVRQLFEQTPGPAPAHRWERAREARRRAGALLPGRDPEHPRDVLGGRHAERDVPVRGRARR